MKSFLNSSTRIILIILVIISCTKDDPIQFSLSVQVSPPEGGNVSLSSGLFEEGEAVLITATPSAEYIFSHWEGAATGTNNPISVVMTSDKTITAVFIKKQYPLTIEIEGEGTVKEEVLSSKSTKDYPSGTSVQLTAEPSSGWTFVEWSEDMTGTENPKSLIVDSPKTVKAKFEPVLYRQILGKWDVRQAAKPQLGSKGTEKECIIYSIVFNEDGSFVLTLDSGQISGTFYFDSSNSIVLNNKGKFDNLHIHNNVLNFHLNLNNLCSSDGTADEDDDHNEGDCVSFLECNDGSVFVHHVGNEYSYIKTTNHENGLWIEFLEFNTNWGCKIDEYNNLDNVSPVIMQLNNKNKLKYKIQHQIKGDGIITLNSIDENSILVTMDFDNDEFDEENTYEKDTQGIFEEYKSGEGCRFTYVPDDNFEQALIDYGYDDILDDFVLTSNIENLGNIDLHGLNISDATGIEDFTSLSGLHIHENNLTSIDLSNNTNLSILWIYDNNLEVLDVSNNSNLRYLFAELNNISEVDVSNNLILEHLAISANPLINLDVTNNEELVRLEVNNTLLTSLNVSQNINLVYLDMNNFDPLRHQHTISSIDLSNNPELLVFISNHTKLTTIDFSNNSKLEHIEIFDTGITELDVSNMDNLMRLETYFNNISCIKVNQNQLANIPEEWVKDESTIYSLDCDTCQSRIPIDGLIAYYPFNGNANDSGPNNINGIVHGAELVNDRFGNPNSAFSFENATATFGNSKDWIELPYDDSFNYNEFTISTWVYARSYYVTNTNNNIQYSALIARHDGGCDVGGAGLRFYIGPDGEFYTEVEGLTPNNIQTFNVVELNKWVMLTITYDGNLINQYVDGNHINELNSNGTITPDNCNTFTFGESYMANGHWYNFDGILDDIGIWNRALTQDEIIGLFNCNN